MSKNCVIDPGYNVENDRYFEMEDTGEFITRKLQAKGVRRICIYSTLADVIVRRGVDDNFTATLQGYLSGEKAQYFDMFRLEGQEDTIYIFATCDADSCIHTKLFVEIPQYSFGSYQAINTFEITTNVAEITLSGSFVTSNLRIKKGKGIVPITVE